MVSNANYVIDDCQDIRGRLELMDVDLIVVLMNGAVGRHDNEDGTSCLFDPGTSRFFALFLAVFESVFLYSREYYRNRECLEIRHFRIFII